MRRSLFVKLNVNVIIFTGNMELLVAKTRKKLASENTEMVFPDIVKSLQQYILSIAEEEGFELDNAYPNRISIKNGGFAWYGNLIFSQDDVTINLRVDIRVSDHPSQPSLEKKNELRMNAFRELTQELDLPTTDLALLDVYCKQHNWGVQLFIGTNKDKDYTSPVTSFGDFERIVRGKLSKLIKEVIK